MRTHESEQNSKLWAMAARFRALAAETAAEPYHHQFEDTATELEQAALGAISLDCLNSTQVC